MLREEQERYGQAYEQRMSEPVSGGGMLFMSVFMLVVLGLLRRRARNSLTYGAASFTS